MEVKREKIKNTNNKINKLKKNNIEKEIIYIKKILINRI